MIECCGAGSVGGSAGENATEPTEAGIKASRSCRWKWSSSVRCVSPTRTPTNDSNASSPVKMRLRDGRWLFPGGLQAEDVHKGDPGGPMELSPLCPRGSAHNELVTTPTKPVLSSRPATARTQRFPLRWGGDCESTYEAMAESLRSGPSSALPRCTGPRCCRCAILTLGRSGEKRVVLPTSGSERTHLARTC